MKVLPEQSAKRPEQFELPELPDFHRAMVRLETPRFRHHYCWPEIIRALFFTRLIVITFKTKIIFKQN